VAVRAFGWNAIVHSVTSGLALMAFGGWLSTRDAARDAYNMAQDNAKRINALEGRVEANYKVYAVVPSLQDDVKELRTSQRWLVGVIYDLARAIDPKLPIKPPPDTPDS